jgi:cellulose biosynthesis protein BcsQ
MKNETKMIAFSNQKGGVGKSTMTILLASYLHYTRGLNVAVVDCDYPQHSLGNMRERDKQAVLKSDYFKQLMMSQFERIGKKAYPILNSTPEEARETADRFLEEVEEHYDLVIVDLPGTVKSQGVFRTIVNMDYVVTPLIADRMVMQSSLAFSTAVLDFIKDKPDIPLKDIVFFWTRMKKSTSADVFNVYCKILERLELTVMQTIVPDTVRYDKELPFHGNTYFRCTLLPPPAKLLKGSGFEEFADELCEMIKLDSHE